MKTAKKLYDYIDHTSKTQFGIGLSSCVINTYYFGAPLAGWLNSAPGGFTLAFFASAAVSVAPIFLSERDIKKTSKEKQKNIDSKKAECVAKLDEYSKIKAQCAAMDELQLTDQAAKKIIVLLLMVAQGQQVTSADLKSTSAIGFGSATSMRSRFTGGLAPAPVDNYRLDAMQLLTRRDDDQQLIAAVTDQGRCRKVWLFFITATISQWLSIFSNTVMILYYGQFSATEAGASLDVALPLGGFLGITIGPLVTYLTATPANKKLKKLEQRLTQLTELRENLDENLATAQQELSLRKEASAMEKYRDVYRQLVEKSQSDEKAINNQLLLQLVKDTKQPAPTKAHSLDAVVIPIKKPDITQPASLSASSPLLSRSRQVSVNLTDFSADSSNSLNTDDAKKSSNTGCICM